jgi:hypothetical protein
MYGLNIRGFIWLDEIVEKLAWKHRVEPYEVEELFRGVPKFRFVENGNHKDEDLRSTGTDRGGAIPHRLLHLEE